MLPGSFRPSPMPRLRLLPIALSKFKAHRLGACLFRLVTAWLSILRARICLTLVMPASRTALAAQESRNWYSSICVVICYCVPATAFAAQESRKNTLRDFVSVAGPLGVTHFVMLSATDNASYIKLAKTPRVGRDAVAGSQ